MQELDEIGLTDIVEDPFVVLILGDRGTGKTALGHRYLEKEHEETDRNCYIYGFPKEKEEYLPSWIQPLDYLDFPQHSTILLHEAHRKFHARRSMSGPNVEVDELVSVSRHRDANIIFETQKAFRLDKNAVASPDAVIFKYPGLLQEKFERRELRKLTEKAKEKLSEYVVEKREGDMIYREYPTEVKKHAYVYANKFEGELPVEIQLPNHWSEEISKAYGRPEIVEKMEERKREDRYSDLQLEMLEDERLKEVMEAAVRWDKKCEKRDWKGFTAGDINATGGDINKLKSLDVLKTTYSSSNKTKYRLRKSRGKIKEEIDGIEG